MADVRYYDVILKPVVTEKSMNEMADKKYTFYVHPEAIRPRQTPLFVLRLNQTAETLPRNHLNEIVMPGT